MGMDWLKGLVGPVAQFSPAGQPVPGQSGAFPPAHGAPGYGAPAAGPPTGGAPPGAWGPPPGAWEPAAPPAAQPAYSPPPAYTAPPATWGAASAPATTGAAAAPDARVAQLELRCEELRRDLESVALFAQTLLAVLEDKRVMTQQDFHEMRRKLDLLDGRLDDRIGKPA